MIDNIKETAILVVKLLTAWVLALLIVGTGILIAVYILDLVAPWIGLI